MSDVEFPKYIEDAVDNIDAAIFSGDAFIDEGMRNEMIDMVDRWKLGLLSTAETFKDFVDEDEFDIILKTVRGFHHNPLTQNESILDLSIAELRCLHISNPYQFGIKYWMLNENNSLEPHAVKFGCFDDDEGRLGKILKSQTEYACHNTYPMHLLRKEGDKETDWSKEVSCGNVNKRTDKHCIGCIRLTVSD